MTIHRFQRPTRAQRLVVAALAFAAFAQAANAALFDDEEARRRIESTNQRLTAVQQAIEDRLATLEQQLKAQGLVDLFNQSEQMRADLAKLRGQIEVLTYELEQAQKRQRDLYVDLDTRLRKLETAATAAATPPVNAAPAAGAGPGGYAAGAGPGGSDAGASPGGSAAGVGPGGSAAGAVPPSTGSPSLNPSGVPLPSSAGPLAPVTSVPARTVDAVAEQRAYDAALDQFKRGDYVGAIAAFGNFVKTYPRSPLAASAQYWIGNAQYARRDYRGAISTQRQLLQAYPESSKAPDALLNIASAQSDQNDSAAARRTLEDLIARYPQSEAATKARQRLGQR